MSKLWRRGGIAGVPGSLCEPELYAGAVFR